MKKFFSLLKVVSRSYEASQLYTGGSKKVFGLSPNSKIYRIAKFVLIAALMLLVGFQSFLFGVSLQGIALNELLIVSFLMLAFMIIFVGIAYSANMLFFARDIPHLMSLPIKSEQVAAAKFIVFNVSISSMLVLVVPAFLAPLYMQSYSLPHSIAILLVLALSSLPFSISSILFTALLLKYTPLGKSRDRFMMFAGIITIVFMLGMVAFIYSLVFSGDSAQDAIESMDLSAAVGVFNASPLRYLFAVFAPFILLLDKLLSPESYLLGLGLSLLVCLAYTAIFYLVFSRIYLNLVIEIQGRAGGGQKQLGRAEQEKQIRSRSMLQTLLKQEYLRLRRSPTLFQQYIIGAVTPVFMYALVLWFAVGKILRTEGYGFSELVGIVTNMGYADYLLPASIALGILLTVTSSGLGYSSSAISLEGDDYFVLKRLPIKLENYLQVKIVLNFLINIVPALIAAIGLGLLLHLPIYLTLLFFAGEFCGIMIASSLSLFFDCASPKLDWEVETQLKNRVVRVYLLMIIDFSLAAFCIAPAGALLLFGYIGPFAAFGIILLTALILLFVLFGLLKKLGVYFLRRIEP